MELIKVAFLLYLLNFTKFSYCLFEKECIGNESQYIPSPNGCEFFIHCTDPVKELKCKEDLYFDKTLMLCDDKEKVNCDISGINPTETTITTVPITTLQPTLLSTIATSPTPLTTLITSSSTIASISTASSSTTTATKPLTSSTTISKTSTIPSSSFSYPTTPIPPTTTKTTTIDTTTPIIKWTTYPNDMATDCPSHDNIDRSIYIQSLSSCSKYYFCFHRQPVVMYCAPNLHFNPITGKCDFMEIVNCELENNSDPNKPTKCTNDIIDFFPHPSRCEYYYYCINGYQTLQQCPFNYYWNNIKKTCELKNAYTC